MYVWLYVIRDSDKELFFKSGPLWTWSKTFGKPHSIRQRERNNGSHKIEEFEKLLNKMGDDDEILMSFGDFQEGAKKPKKKTTKLIIYYQQMPDDYFYDNLISKDHFILAQRITRMKSGIFCIFEYIDGKWEMTTSFYQF